VFIFGGLFMDGMLKSKIKKMDDETKEELRDYLSNLLESGCKKIATENWGSKELKKEFSALASVWSDESRLRTWATIKILEALEKKK
jgi:hypothetical protein